MAKRGGVDHSIYTVRIILSLLMGDKNKLEPISKSKYKIANETSKTHTEAYDQILKELIEEGSIIQHKNGKHNSYSINYKSYVNLVVEYSNERRSPIRNLSKIQIRNLILFLKSKSFRLYVKLFLNYRRGVTYSKVINIYYSIKPLISIMSYYQLYGSSVSSEKEFFDFYFKLIARDFGHGEYTNWKLETDLDRIQKDYGYIVGKYLKDNISNEIKFLNDGYSVYDALFL